MIVNGCVPNGPPDSTALNVRDDIWSFAMDQRAFGPRMLLVAFADADGTFRGLAYAKRREPIDLVFEACLRHLGKGAAAAVGFLDERVVAGPIAAWSTARFERLHAAAAAHGITLVDWISCDDEYLRATRAGDSGPADTWWNVPST